MSTHTATIRWSQKDGDDYPRGRYSRVHEIAFDGGVVVEASGAPQNVPAQFSSYEDQAEGVMAKNAAGRTAMATVTLRPKVECKGAAGLLAELHHKAHDACFIANSVTTEVVVEPVGGASE